MSVELGVCSLDTFFILFISFQGEGLEFGMRAVYIVVWFGLWVWEGCEVGRGVKFKCY
jgi:hypothetical protein